MAERDAEGLTFVNGAMRQWGNEAMELGNATNEAMPMVPNGLNG